jgi:hypothetical protein
MAVLRKARKFRLIKPFQFFMQQYDRRFGMPDFFDLQKAILLLCLGLMEERKILREGFSILHAVFICAQRRGGHTMCLQLIHIK